MADTDISADGRKNTADRNSRISVSGHQNVGEHRSCCRLSVCTGNGDRCIVVAHDLSEQLGTGQHRNTGSFCRNFCKSMPADPYRSWLRSSISYRLFQHWCRRTVLCRGNGNYHGSSELDCCSGNTKNYPFPGNRISGRWRVGADRSSVQSEIQYFRNYCHYYAELYCN